MALEMELTVQQQEGARQLAKDIAYAVHHWGHSSVEHALTLADLHDFARGPQASKSLQAHSKALRKARDTLSLASESLASAIKPGSSSDQQRIILNHAQRLVQSTLLDVMVSLTKDG